MGELRCKAGMKLVAGATPFDPQNKIEPFCIDKHEFTQKEKKVLDCVKSGDQFQLIVKKCSGSKFVAATGAESALRKKAAKLAGPQKPLVNLKWKEARAVCKARGMDLPSDEQWQKAATGSDGKMYATKSGDLKKSEANFASDRPVDVMSYPPNDFGVYDMTGNVWEWTLGDADGRYYRIRGGSWNEDDPLLLRSSYHGYFLPELEFNVIGFRCVAQPEKSKK